MMPRRHFVFRHRIGAGAELWDRQPDRALLLHCTGWLGGVLLDVMNIYLDQGAATFVQGSGDILWTIDIDWPLGNMLGTSRYLPNYASIKTQLGSFEDGPWPVRAAGA